MDHVQALQEIIKYQKEKIEKLEMELAVEKAKPVPEKVDYVKYLQAQKMCTHEYNYIQSGSLLGGMAHGHCKKCGNWPSTPINQNQFFGGAQLQQQIGYQQQHPEYQQLYQIYCAQQGNQQSFASQINNVAVLANAKNG